MHSITMWCRAVIVTCMGMMCIVEVFCTSETFRAACQPGHVVVVRQALYGRLTAGRCITSEYAHALGCYADVTAHVQDACSAAAWRQNCSLLVATVDAIAQPCGKDFKSYLDIEHDCVAGTKQAKLFLIYLWFIYNKIIIVVVIIMMRLFQW